MTKKAMIDYIEQSNVCANKTFPRAMFNRMLKERVEEHYNYAVEYTKRKAQE